MADDWIKMRTRLWDHPKVVKLASAICPQSVRDLSTRCRIIGALYRTWALADAHTEDGILDGYDAEALDAAVGIEGWSLNLQHVGWLIVESQRLVIPRFTDHNGASAKRRAEDARRKKNVRKSSADRPENVRNDSDRLRTRSDQIREDTDSELTDHMRCAFKDSDGQSRAKDLGASLASQSGYSGDDGAIFVAAASLVGCGLSENDVRDAAEACRVKQPKNVPAYFRRVLADRLAKRGGDLDVLLKGGVR